MSGSFSGLSGYKRSSNKNRCIHKPKRLNYKRWKVKVAGIDEKWLIDLIDVKNIKRSNYDVSYYLLTFLNF